MRFVLGLAIGFGVGFAGALLFAPDRSRGQQAEIPGGAVEGGAAAFDEDHDILNMTKRALQSLREQVNEAMKAAKRAQKETEREMRARYEMEAGRKVEEGEK